MDPNSDMNLILAIVGTTAGASVRMLPSEGVRYREERFQEDVGEFRWGLDSSMEAIYSHLTHGGFAPVLSADMMPATRRAGHKHGEHLTTWETCPRESIHSPDGRFSIILKTVGKPEDGFTFVAYNHDGDVIASYPLKVAHEEVPGSKRYRKAKGY